MQDDEDTTNADTFRECLAELITSRLAPTKAKRKVKGRKNEIKPVANNAEDEATTAAEDLADFIEYLSAEIFTSLPTTLRTLTHATLQDNPDLATTYSLPLDSSLRESLTASLPPSVPDSFETYALLPPTQSLDRLLTPVYESYITTASTPPPEHAPTTQKATACEICDREQLPLTYHHLIPRQVHAKAVRRGWVKEWEVNKVAWLCRACHSFVHRVASNEELGREYGSVELLMEREDVQAWAGWVGRIRWKKR